MRKAVVLAAVASFATIALCVTPSSAMQRVANPGEANVLVTPIADLDRQAARPDRKHGRALVYRHGRDHGYWDHRLSAGRWLHYQYVNAGYPSRRHHKEVYYTYFPGDYCCRHHRHWRWYGHDHGYWHRHGHW
jgi:hypothetical protein